jgi:hypothetical protein
MALHRDIHWIGRHWAVTGYGMQAIDQRHGGAFDIEIARLWEDGLLESLREQKWFNADDFAKGLAIARKRYPEPPRKSASSPPPVETLLRVSGFIRPPQKPSAIETPAIPRANPVEPQEPPPLIFEMRIPGRARFVRPWHIRFK